MTARFPVGSFLPVDAADFIILNDFGVYRAMSLTGVDVYHGSDPGEALTEAIGTLGPAGGTIRFRPGFYNWGSTPLLPPNLTSWLKITGQPGTYIILNGTSNTSGKRFLDFHRTAAGDTFQWLELADFTIDGGALPLTGHQHVVLGTYNQRGIADGNQVNMAHIRIHGIDTLDIPVANDATGTGFEYLNVFLAVNHNAAGQPANTMTDIEVERCNFQGGNYGVAVYGSKEVSTPWSGDPDIFLDDILVDRVKHDMGTAPPNFTYAAHVHIGSQGYGQSCKVSNIRGYGSRDVGVEVDGMRQARISNVTVGDTYGFAIAATNYNALVGDPHNQEYTLTDISSRQTGGRQANNAASLLGQLRSNDGTGTVVPFGTLRCRNINRFRDTTVLISDDELEGDLIRFQAPTELYVDGATYNGINILHTSTSFNPSPTLIYNATVVGGVFSEVKIRNTHLRWQGTYDAAALEADLTGIWIAGNTNLLIENVTTDFTTTNPKSFSIRGIQLGGVGGSTMRGTIRGYRVVANNAAGGRGILVQTSSLLTVAANTAFFIEGCDFRNLATFGGTEVVFLDNTNKPRFYMNRNNWKVYPQIPYAITAPASATATQYIDGWPATFAVTGANTTLLERSRDNTNWATVGTTANPCVFHMEQGDWFRLTYTVAPTISVLADNS